MNQSGDRRRRRPGNAGSGESYRPPQEEVERLRVDLGDRPVRRPGPATSNADRPPVRQHDTALAGDPATEGERITVELPLVPTATEGPSSKNLPLEGPQPTPELGSEIAAGLVRPEVRPGRPRSNPMRRRIRQALSSPDRIREAFVLQAVIGQPKGLASEEDALEGR